MRSVSTNGNAISAPLRPQSHGLTSVNAASSTLMVLYNPLGPIFSEWKMWPSTIPPILSHSKKQRTDCTAQLWPSEKSERRPENYGSWESAIRQFVPQAAVSATLLCTQSLNHSQLRCTAHYCPEYETKRGTSLLRFPLCTFFCSFPYSTVPPTVRGTVQYCKCTALYKSRQ